MLRQMNISNIFYLIFGVYTGTCAYLVSPFMVSLTEQGWLSLGVSVTLRLVKTKAVSSLKFKDLSTLCQGKITLLYECMFCPEAGPSLYM